MIAAIAAIQNAKRIAFQGEPGARSDGQPSASEGVARATKDQGPER